jgi:hypothetical protein
MVALMSSLGAPLIPTIAAADHVALPAARWLLTAAQRPARRGAERAYRR